MAKKYLLRSYYPIDEKDDQEKELYLNELGNSVHRYIKKGIKNSQLDELLTLKSKFQEKYEERFNIQRIIDLISESSKNKVLELEHVKVKIDRHTLNVQQNDYNYLLNKIYEKVINATVEVINNHMQKVLKDAAYLSHINMLYEIYEKEEKLRREEKEFEKIFEKYQKMADITREISKKKRVKLEELEQQVNISKTVLDELLNKNDLYFNTRDKNDFIQISLSTVGKKYNDYISNKKNNYSNEMMNQLIYKNCNNLIESLESSYESGFEIEPKLEGLNPDKERAIRNKYNRTIQKMIVNNEDVYSTNNFIIVKASVNKNNEKMGLKENRFTIPKYWDDRDVY